MKCAGQERVKDSSMTNKTKHHLCGHKMVNMSSRCDKFEVADGLLAFKDLFITDPDYQPTTSIVNITRQEWACSLCDSRDIVRVTDIEFPQDFNEIAVRNTSYPHICFVINRGFGDEDLVDMSEHVEAASCLWAGADIKSFFENPHIMVWNWNYFHYPEGVDWYRILSDRNEAVYASGSWLKKEEFWDYHDALNDIRLRRRDEIPLAFRPNLSDEEKLELHGKHVMDMINKIHNQ